MQGCVEETGSERRHACAQKAVQVGQEAQGTPRRRRARARPAAVRTLSELAEIALPEAVESTAVPEQTAEGHPAAARVTSADRVKSSMPGFFSSPDNSEQVSAVMFDNTFRSARCFCVWKAWRQRFVLTVVLQGSCAEAFSPG